MVEIKAIVRPDRLEDIIRALHAIPNLPGVTVSVVRGIGRQHGGARAGVAQYGEIVMAKLETVVPDDLIDRVVAAVREIGQTGRAGDGKIFVSEIQRAINIRDDAEGAEIL